MAWPPLLPSLWTRDMKATLVFYRRLGFRLAGREPETGTPRWVELRGHGAVLHFFTEPWERAEAPHCTGTFYFFPPNWENLAQRVAREFELAWGPENMPYGWREFGLRDPNGYWLAFAEVSPPEGADHGSA